MIDLRRALARAKVSGETATPSAPAQPAEPEAPATPTPAEGEKLSSALRVAPETIGETAPLASAAGNPHQLVGAPGSPATAPGTDARYQGETGYRRALDQIAARAYPPDWSAVPLTRKDK